MHQREERDRAKGIKIERDPARTRERDSLVQCRELMQDLVGKRAKMGVMLRLSFDFAAWFATLEISLVY